MDNRTAILVKLLDMKDRMITNQGGIIEVDSYSGNERKELKDELYQIVNPELEMKGMDKELKGIDEELKNVEKDV